MKTIDTILDSVPEHESTASALANYLDKRGGWDWSADSEHEPCDRVAVVESSGAFWAVYRGTEPDDAVRFATEEAAQAKTDEWIEQSTGAE